MRRAGALVRGTRAVQQCPPPFGDGRRPAILPARWPACLAGEATGSVESTPAHTLPESMLSAALGTSCRAASGPGPFPARCSQSWGRRALECGWGRGARRPAVVLWRSGSLHSLCSAPARLSSTALAAGNRGVDVIPAPRGQVEGWVARGLAVRLPARWTRSVRSPRARTPCREQTGWKRVCEHPALGAHTRSHTQSLGFIATAP